MSIIKVIVFLIFTMISAIHVYWAFGGKWGSNVAIPTVNGTKAFIPSNFATFIVAISIAICGLLYLILAFGQHLNLPIKHFLPWLGWLVTLIFIARSIGDFHLVGFFKTVNGTEFSIMDTRFYSPLCIFIGLNFAYVTYKWG